MTRRVLFICTGNYYRSRFAEALFNFEAEKRNLPWRAFSRGMAVHLAEGFLSPFTAEALLERKIELRHTGPDRVQLGENDLTESEIRIGLDRNEHYPMIAKIFPAWLDQIQFWDVQDLPFQSHTDALPAIEKKVIHLLSHLPK
ncbi:MAG: protein-tyrosine-phosphatase [Verrucomicrobia bacterium]|nr:protein-tyrosine-phosphatase [Verrucomicrobiota bacterium]MBV9672803.1 protein-tyrosine-phosphatase [Verrucomicrobiota bacterium]